MTAGITEVRVRKRLPGTAEQLLGLPELGLTSYPAMTAAFNL